MQLSHSRVGCFLKCPYQFKLQYLDKLETLPRDDPQDALNIGLMLHTAIEKGIDVAIEEYYAKYPIVTDLHENEVIKMQYWYPKIMDQLPQGIHEVLIEDEDFKGFIDLLVPVEEESKIPDYEYYDLFDFKYSNNIENYLESEQLHLYKYYFEKLNPTKRIRDMYFMFVPKTGVRIKYKNKKNPRDETLYEFRQRMLQELEQKQISFVYIPYNPNKVIEFITNGKRLIECENFDKNPSRLCDWCQYQRYCEKGEDIDMQLPSTKRRTVETVEKRKIWIYGAPFSGKTYLADKFPDPLMLNTDGNIKFVTAPFIPIKDDVTVEGRITKKKFAWDVFKETIDELEKKQNDFKTIIVDLVEDTYEYCRLYMYDQMGITHESDDSFRAWDKVRTEFLSNIKRLMNLDYENIILISHEDTSKDVTKRSGDKITAIKPNINDKVANKLAGMVDIVMRAIAEDGKYTLSFKTSEVIFGGGRLSVNAKEIANDYNAMMKVYDEANRGSISDSDTKKSDGNVSEAARPESIHETNAESIKSVRKTRKLRAERKKEETETNTREVTENATGGENKADMGEVTEEPAPRRRRRKKAE